MDNSLRFHGPVHRADLPDRQQGETRTAQPVHFPAIHQLPVEHDLFRPTKHHRRPDLYRPARMADHLVHFQGMARQKTVLHSFLAIHRLGRIRYLSEPVHLSPQLAEYGWTQARKQTKDDIPKHSRDGLSRPQCFYVIALTVVAGFVEVTGYMDREGLYA